MKILMLQDEFLGKNIVDKELLTEWNSVNENETRLDLNSCDDEIKSIISDNFAVTIGELSSYDFLIFWK
jgi:hypothetical protein